MSSLFGMKFCLLTKWADIDWTYFWNEFEAATKSIYWIPNDVWKAVAKCVVTSIIYFLMFCDCNESVWDRYH